MNLSQAIAENQALKEQNSLLEKRLEQMQAAYDSVYHLLQELKRHRFGTKSERFLDEIQQGSLFGQAFPDLSEKPADEKDGTITVPEHTRKQKKSKKDLIATRIEIIPVPDADKICACGTCMEVVRHESKFLQHYQPATHELIEQRREVVACPKGCIGGIKTAPAPLQILPKVGVTEEMLAFLVTSKVEDRQPLYHLEKQLRDRHHIDCSRQTMARWMIDLMFPLQPLVNLIKETITGHNISFCDATTLQVLNEPDRRAETKSYVYCMRGGPPDKQAIIYEYNHEKHKAFVRDWYAEFSGYLHADGDQVFDLLDERDDIHLVHCNSHSRRKFEPIAKTSKKQGVAKEALRFFKALYKIERRAKKENMSPEQRYALRQEHSKPLFNQFIQWLDQIAPTVLPESPLGKAIEYARKRRGSLARFLEDGRLEIDNNGTEQKIKPFVIARKNFLFAQSQDGAKSLCLHFSLIQTAKLHGLEPYRYYVTILKNIPHCQTVEDFEKLLPWNIAEHYPELR